MAENPRKSSEKVKTFRINCFLRTLIIDDETQRLACVIDRLQLSDSGNNEISHHLLPPNKQLNGEFIIPIRCNKKNSSVINILTASF